MLSVVESVLKVGFAKRVGKRRLNYALVPQTIWSMWPICHGQQELCCCHPQLNALFMHINMHYTTSNTLSSAFHNPPMHAYPNPQDVHVYRDDVKLLWPHFYLVWLVFEGCIPICLHSFRKLFLWLVLPNHHQMCHVYCLKSTCFHKVYLELIVFVFVMNTVFGCSNSCLMLEQWYSGKNFCT